MTRKLAYAGFSYMAGLMAASFIGFMPSAAAAVLFGTAACVLTAVHNPKRFMAVIVCLIFSALGLSAYSAHDEYVCRKTAEYSYQEVCFTGKIFDYDEAGSDRCRYTLKGRINGEYSTGILLYSEKLDIDIGDNVSFSGKVFPMKNTYVFAQEDYFKCRGIYFAAYPSKISTERVNDFSLRRVCAAYGRYIRKLIQKYLPGTCGDFLAAMLLGDKSALDSNIKQAVYRAGFGHIMAVSGIHLTIIAMFLKKLMEAVTPFNKKEIFIVSAFPLFAFCLMSGMSVSVIRAYVMLVIVGLADLFGRQSDTMNSLGIAGLILTAANPYSIRDTGLILSFAGVIGIGVIAPKVIRSINDIITNNHNIKGKSLKKLPMSVIGSFCVYAFVFPFSLIIFDEVSIISPFTDVLLVPLCTVSLIFCAAAALLGWWSAGAGLFIRLAGVFTNPVLYFADIISDCKALYIPGGYTVPKFIALAGAAAVIVLLLCRRDILHIVLLSFCTAAVCIVSVNVCRIAESKHVYAAFLNSGNGSAAVIRRGGRAAVIDLGNGGECAEKYLLRSGVYSVDTIMLTDAPASEITSYMDRFGEFEIASFYCEEGTVIGSDRLKRKELVGYYGGSSVITGEFYRIYTCENGDIIIDIDGSKFIIAENENVCGSYCCAYLWDDKSYNISGSDYIVISENAECVSCDGTLYESCCAEFDVFENNVEGRVIFVGGDNRIGA